MVRWLPEQTEVDRLRPSLISYNANISAVDTNMCTRYRRYATKMIHWYTDLTDHVTK